MNIVNTKSEVASPIHRLALQHASLSRRSLCASLMVSIGPLMVPLKLWAQGMPKFALLVGNSKYLGRDRSLANPESDAQLMAKSLAAQGFDVSVGFNLGRKDMLKAVSDFTERLPEGALSFVFYAGHGMQLGGLNYLIPVDMQPNSEQAVQLAALPMRTVMERMAASRAAVNVMVLDACRNNPFQQEILVRMRSITPRNGLAAVKAPRGTLVAYSTAPGQLAADGKGGNSLYADSLARMLREPGLSLEQIFKRVGQQVRERTADAQIPWFESSLSDDVFL